MTGGLDGLQMTGEQLKISGTDSSPAGHDNRGTKWALIFLVAGLIIRLAIVWQPPSYHLGRGPLIDDAFYSLSIARNLARGLGPTFDGINPTNGFQPLYVFFMTPVYAFIPEGRSFAPIYLALTLLAVANIGAGFFLFRIARRRWGETAGLFALGLFCFSPDIINQGLNGLETSLAVLMSMVSLDWYLGRIRPGNCPVRAWLALGMTLAILVFTRLDGGLLAVAIALDYLLRPHPGSAPLAGRIKIMSGITLTALFLYSPWAAWNLHSFGRLTPVSGEAVRFISLQAARSFFQMKGVEASEKEVRDFLVHRLSIPAAISVVGANPVFFPTGLIGSWLQLHDALTGRRLIFSWWLPFGLLAVGFIWFLRVENQMGVLPAAVALVLISYIFFVFGFWYFKRYFNPAVICLLLMGTAIFRSLSLKLPANLRRPASGMLIAVYALNFILTWPFLFSQPSPWNFAHCYRIAETIDAVTPEGSRVGVFQAGAAGYFSRRTVINLDGVVNEPALSALKKKELVDYLISNKIEYVADDRNQLRNLLWTSLKPGEREKFIPLTPSDSPIPVYRIRSE